MPPETLRNSSYNRKSDIWSLGCTLLELATGRAPWYERKFDNEFAALFVIANDDIVPHVPENLDPRIKQLIAGCFKR